MRDADVEVKGMNANAEDSKTGIHDIASDLLHDINVVHNLAVPDLSRRKFSFLQPYYAKSHADSLVERLVVAYKQLADEDKQRFRKAVVEALQRCATDWQGIPATLVLVELAHQIAPGDVSTDTWARLLERRDPDGRQTDAYREQLISLLDRLNIEIVSPHVAWESIIEETPVDVLMGTIGWTLYQNRLDPDRSTDIVEVVIQKLNPFPGRKTAFTSVDTKKYIQSIIEANYLPAISRTERLNLLNQIGFFSSPGVQVGEEDYRGELDDFVSRGTDSGWTEEDFLFEKQHAYSSSTEFHANTLH